MIESNGGTRPVKVSGRPGSEVSVTRFSVLVVEGPDKGHRAQLGSTSLRVGTGSANDLVLTDPTVSRQHAILTLTPGGILLEDLGSMNGSVVDGTRIRSAYVHDSSAVKMGDTVLRISPTETRFVVIPDDRSAFEGMVARSRVMRDIFTFIRQVAKTDLPVAINGETGTGKELIARALHNAGPRKERRFVVLDCGSILPELLRSELFGHERGAFTGADRQTKGVLEEADGGTVFLDEIGEIHLSVQPNLLRALETKEVTRVGSRSPVPVDFRVVSATNRDLKKASEVGTFRQDLYYRLSCVTIRVPPLRDRREDIPLLVEHFLKQCADRHQLSVPKLNAAALDRMVSHSWPGNLRELRNVVESAWVIADGGPIVDQHICQALPQETGTVATPPTRGHGGSLEEIEKRSIQDALVRTNWNRKEAARLLEIARTTLLDKIRRFGLKPPGSAGEDEN